MFREMFFNFFKKKEPKPEEYNIGPFATLYIVQEYGKWRIFASSRAGMLRELGTYTSAILDTIDLNFPIKEALQWVSWYRLEPEPYEEAPPWYSEHIRKILGSTDIPYGSMVAEITAALGYNIWCKEDIISEEFSTLRFIVWPEE